MTSRMSFELIGFLLSTNAKVKKMMTVSAVIFEIVKSVTIYQCTITVYKYILLVRVICEKYRLRGEANIPSHFSGEGHLTVLETGIFPACMPLFYLLLNIRRN
jgi:hypothetical protein